MNRVGEVWDTGNRVFVILEEDEANSYVEDSICVILILHDDFDRAVGTTTGQWVPRDEGTQSTIVGAKKWKRIASIQS